MWSSVCSVISLSWYWLFPAAALAGALVTLVRANRSLAAEQRALAASRERLRRLAVAHDDLRHDSDRVVPEYRAVRSRLLATLRRRSTRG